MNLDLVDAVVQRLTEEKAPLSYAKLSEAFVGKSRGNTEGVLKEAIREALNVGRAFHWGSYARSKQCYWYVSRNQWLGERIVTNCTAVAQTTSNLKFPGFPTTAIRTAIGDLIATGKLQKYPGIGRERVRIGTSPQAYASALREFVVKKLEKANLPQNVFFSSATAASGAIEPRRVDEGSGRGESAMTDRILEAMPRLERPGLPLASVVLRRSLGIQDANKRDFDRALVHLSDQGKVYLSAHHDPHGLSVEDRNNLIDGGDGRYFVAVTLLGHG